MKRTASTDPKPASANKQNADEQTSRVELLARDEDEVAEPGVGAEELGDHDADQAARDALSQPRDDERQRARKADLGEDLRLRGPERTRDFDQVAIAVGEAGIAC